MDIPALEQFWQDSFGESWKGLISEAEQKILEWQQRAAHLRSMKVGWDLARNMANTQDEPKPGP